MIRIKRTIYVDDQAFPTFFSMKIGRNKGKSNVTIYYHTEDPYNKGSRMMLIKGGFPTKEDAIRYAVSYMRNMYKDMINR